MSQVEADSQPANTAKAIVRIQSGQRMTRLDATRAPLPGSPRRLRATSQFPATNPPTSNALMTNAAAAETYRVVSVVL